MDPNKVVIVGSGHFSQAILTAINNTPGYSGHLVDPTNPLEVVVSSEEYTKYIDHVANGTAVIDHTDDGYYWRVDLKLLTKTRKVQGNRKRKRALYQIRTVILNNRFKFMY